MHFPFHISVVLLANIYKHNQATTNMDMESKMLLYDLLTLLKDTVILDLFLKNTQKMITSLVASKRQWCLIFHDIKILMSQCYLEGTIILISLLFRKLQYG